MNKNRPREIKCLSPSSGVASLVDSPKAMRGGICFLLYSDFSVVLDDDNPLAFMIKMNGNEHCFTVGVFLCFSVCVCMCWRALPFVCVCVCVYMHTCMHTHL